jgi:predicted transcriptional regulator
LSRGESKIKMRRKPVRGRWEIILDILRAISEGGGVVKKTHIMQKAHLDWRNFQKHFNFLLEQGFVDEREEPGEGKVYVLTEEGKNLQKRLRDVKEALRQNV